MAKAKQFKDTPKGKAIRTTYQSLVAWLPVLLGVLTLPEVRNFVEGNTAGTGAIVAVIAGILSYLQNRKDK